MERLCFLVLFNMRDYTVKQEHLLSYNLIVYFIFFFCVISGQQQNQHTCRNTHSHRFCSSLPSTSCLQTTQIVAVAVVTLASPLHPPTQDLTFEDVHAVRTYEKA